jgi:hypothetical protein
VFPTEGDTGVYFLTGEKKYENKSNKVQVINKGAVDQMLTVTAKLTASEGGKDIAVLDAAPTAEATTAGLYLTAKVAGATQALSTTGASWIINLTGNDANYEVAVKDNAYVYQKKTSGLSAWKAADIEVTGAVTNGIAVASDTTAPKITLTWKFDDIPQTAPSWTADTELSDYSDAPASAAPSITTTSYVMEAGKAIDVSVNLGSGDAAATGVTSIKWGNVDLISKNYASYADGKITLTSTLVDILRGKDSESYTIDIVFNDTSATATTVTLTKE